MSLHLPVSLPLLCLSTDTQRMIYTKLDNYELVKISLACSQTKQQIENLNRILSSRPFYGDVGRIENTTSHYGNVLKISNESIGGDQEIDENFHKKLTALSFYHLDVEISDKSQIPVLLMFLKNWKPLLKTAEINISPINAEDLAAIIDTLSCSTSICVKLNKRRYSDSQRIHSALIALREHRFNKIIQIDLTGSYEYATKVIFDDVQNFGGISVKTTETVVSDFFQAILTEQAIFNLKWVKFWVDFQSPRDSFLRDKNLISGATVLFLDVSKSRRIQKIPLYNDKCIITHEDNRGLKAVSFSIVKNNENIILDVVLDILGIKHFTMECRQRYFAMNDEERADELKTAQRLSNRNFKF